MNIIIYGLGYVGLTAAGCLCKQGHEILGVDINETKIREINAGNCPIKEPGLDELVSVAVKANKLRCSTTTGGKIDKYDLAIVCVGTPSGPDGSHNMSYIAEVSRQIAEDISKDRSEPLTVAFRSTVRPGTMQELIRPIFDAVLGTEKSSAVELVYNPEFLREATAINDFFFPPKVVVGTVDGGPSSRMEDLNKGISAKVFYTGYREAELTKFVDNSFHALKVCFANEIGRVCDSLGIKASKVHEIFVSDTKLNISPAYLRPGGAFGGSCLPKDVRALQYLASEIGVNAPVCDALIRSNDAHKHFIYEHCVKDTLRGSTVLMLGLAFKADSDDLRESPKVDLARRLLQSGYKLSIYEPALRPSEMVGQNLGYGFSHLPQLPRLLVSKEDIAETVYDLVIDTGGSFTDLQIASRRVLNIDRLL